MSRFRLRHLWIVVPFWAFAIKATVPITNDRFLIHVRTGMDQLAGSEVLRADPYSFTQQGSPWRSISWLVEALFGRLEASMPELTWVPLFVFAVAAATLAVVLVVAAAQRPSLAGMAVVAAGIGIAFLAYTDPGPAMVGYLLLAVLMGVVMAPTSLVWVVPGVIWMWAAIDGSFVIGLAILGLDAVRRRSGRRGLAVVLGILAASLTAHGFALWGVVWRSLESGSLLDGTAGWVPPELTSAAGLPFLAMIGAIMFGLATQRIGADALWLLVPAVIGGIVIAPLVFPAVIVASPWLARAVGGLPRRREEDSAADRWIVGITAVALLVSGAVLLMRPVRLSAGIFPSRSAVAILQPGPAFHDVASGGGLIYAYGRERPVFIDGRSELYSSAFFQRHAEAMDGVRWDELFESWGIHQVLLPPERPVARMLLANGWVTCYVDADFVVLSDTGCPQGV